MDAPDCLFRTTLGLFSYRVAGILIEGERILLQHTIGGTDYAFPGGHVGFGETAADAIAREFREEIGAEIRPLRLIWVGENFFPWGKDDCHQIGLYYLVERTAGTIMPTGDAFFGKIDPGKTAPHLVFTWVPLTALESLELYPPIAKEKLASALGEIEHFVYRQ